MADVAKVEEVDVVSPASDAFITVVVDLMRVMRITVRIVRMVQHVQIIDLPPSSLFSSSTIMQPPRNPCEADRRPASSACSRSSFSSISFSFGQFLCQCFKPGQNLQR